MRFTFPCSTSGARRGMTLPELIIGLTISSIVLLAMATFSISMARGWAASNQAQASGATVQRAGVQISSLLRKTLAIVQTKVAVPSDTSSYAFYWAYDGFGGVADNVAQAGEMGLLEYDPTNNTIWLYQSIDVSQMTTTQLAAAAISNWGDLSSPAVVDYFKNQSFLAPRRAIVGPGTDLNSTAPRVISGSFSSSAPANGKPVARWWFKVQPNETSSDVTRKTEALFGSVVLRSAQTPTNSGS